jgi:hypothetical protein
MLVIVTGVSCSVTGARDRPRAEYDETGHLRRVVYDANDDGHNDSVGYVDRARIIRIEIDLDDDGDVDQWLFYGENGALYKVGLSRGADGVMDRMMHYTPSGVLERIDASTERDSIFDRTEFYENGRLVRAQEDMNRDGRPDKWETYEPVADVGHGENRYAITSVAFDTTGRGRPEKRFVFGRNGVVQRVEVDVDVHHGKTASGRSPEAIR